MLKFGDVAIYYPGMMPLILCSHHDGQNAALNGAPLLKLRERHNDEGTRDLSLRTTDIMERTRGKSPHLLIFDIRIQTSTNEMFNLYIAKVRAVIGDCLKCFGKCAVIDIHRFYKHPEFTCDIRREYDIWFGTDHRRSVYDDFDKRIAAAIIEAYKKFCSQEISIYVPEEKNKIGESFGATGKTPERTILTKVISDTFANQPVNAIQAEFYIDHLRKGAPMVKMAIALANAIAQTI